GIATMAARGELMPLTIYVGDPRGAPTPTIELALLTTGSAFSPTFNVRRADVVSTFRPARDGQYEIATAVCPFGLAPATDAWFPSDVRVVSPVWPEGVAGSISFDLPGTTNLDPRHALLQGEARTQLIYMVGRPAAVSRDLERCAVGA